MYKNVQIESANARNAKNIATKSEQNRNEIAMCLTRKATLSGTPPPRLTLQNNSHSFVCMCVYAGVIPPKQQAEFFLSLSGFCLIYSAAALDVCFLLFALQCYCFIAHTHMLANICMHISMSIRHLIHTYHTHLFMALFSISVRQLFWLEYSLVVCFHFSSTHCLLPFLDVFDLLLRNGKPNNSVNGGASRMQQCKQ